VSGYREVSRSDRNGSIRMLNIDRYFDAIDAARIRRVRELSEIKRQFGADDNGVPIHVYSKAAVVLTYANWEGFYNECVDIYVTFLTERGGKVRETDWMLLVGAFNADFESLRSRNHSVDAKQQFVANLKTRMECCFDLFDRTTIQAMSNLDYKRIAQNYLLLSFELSALQRFRIRLDKELVGWRHSVAHGDSPDLSALDIADHVDFTAHLLSVVADCFQYAMLERSPAQCPPAPPQVRPHAGRDA
jgi:hypothetical protein